MWVGCRSQSSGSGWSFRFWVQCLLEGYKGLCTCFGDVRARVFHSVYMLVLARFRVLNKSFY